MHERVYHANSLDLMTRFDPAGIAALDHSHGDADKKEHLTLLHATREEMSFEIIKAQVRGYTGFSYCLRDGRGTSVVFYCGCWGHLNLCS